MEHCSFYTLETRKPGHSRVKGEAGRTPHGEDRLRKEKPYLLPIRTYYELHTQLRKFVSLESYS